MFESLSDRFSSLFRNLSGRGRISEENVRDAMKEVRTALLEADVHYDVVNRFVSDVTQKAAGAEVLASLQPGQQMVKIVFDELVTLMGEPPEEGAVPGVAGPGTGGGRGLCLWTRRRRSS